MLSDAPRRLAIESRYSFSNQTSPKFLLIPHTNLFISIFIFFSVSFHLTFRKKMERPLSILVHPLDVSIPLCSRVERFRTSFAFVDLSVDVKSFVVTFETPVDD